MIILSIETKFFSVALEHFLNNLISKNPVYICFSGSNGLQETKVVNFWKDIYLSVSRKNISMRVDAILDAKNWDKIL